MICVAAYNFDHSFCFICSILSSAVFNQSPSPFLPWALKTERFLVLRMGRQRSDSLARADDHRGAIRVARTILTILYRLICSILCPAVFNQSPYPFLQGVPFSAVRLWLPSLFQGELARAKICLIQI